MVRPESGPTAFAYVGLLIAGGVLAFPVWFVLALGCGDGCSDGQRQIVWGVPLLIIAILVALGGTAMRFSVFARYGLHITGIGIVTVAATFVLIWATGTRVTMWFWPVALLAGASVGALMARRPRREHGTATTRRAE